MKVYEKPRLVALSISGNDMLCKTCMIDAIGDNADPDYKQTIALLIEAGIAVGSLFDANSTCQVPVEGYCKYTSVNVIINS